MALLYQIPRIGARKRGVHRHENEPTTTEGGNSRIAATLDLNPGGFETRPYFLYFFPLQLFNFSTLQL